MPRIETTLTTAPPPASTIGGAVSRLRAKAAVRFTSSTSAKRSGVSDSTGSGVPTPALLTRTSMRPNRSSVTSTSRSLSASRTTSHPTARALPRCVASDSSRSARRAATTTEAPAPASTRAKRSPSPLDAPVTMATRPSSRNGARTSVISGQQVLHENEFEPLGADVGHHRGQSGDGARVARVQTHDRAGLHPLAHAGFYGARARIEVVARIDVEATHGPIPGEPGLLHHDLGVVALHA